MLLRYSNYEIEKTVFDRTKPLNMQTLYYFSPAKLPDGMIPKNVYSDYAVTPFKIGDMMFDSAKQAICCIMRFIINETLNGEEKRYFDMSYMKLDKTCMDIYKCNSPYHVNVLLGTKLFNTSEKTVYEDWIDFVRLLVYRYKFSPANSGRMSVNLLSSGNKILAYAHMNDSIEGIYENPVVALKRFSTPTQWKGQNRCGRTLMMVRDNLRDIPSIETDVEDNYVYRIVVRCKNPGLMRVHLRMIEILINVKPYTFGYEESEDDLVFIPVKMKKLGSKSKIFQLITCFLEEYPGIQILDF